MSSKAYFIYLDKTKFIESNIDDIKEIGATIRHSSYDSPTFNWWISVNATIEQISAIKELPFVTSTREMRTAYVT